MESQQREEWAGLERTARAWLEQPPQRRGLAVEAHAVLLPSFEYGVASTLFVPSPRGRDVPLGVRRVWRRGLDLAKLENPVARLRHGPRLEPTLEERDVEPAGEAVEGLARRIAQLRVPVRAAEDIVLDGETHVLSLGARPSARFTWSGAPPAGWEELGELARAIAQRIESALA